MATFRVFGKEVAEMPLFTTSKKFGQQGMCHLILYEQEEKILKFSKYTFANFQGTHMLQKLLGTTDEVQVGIVISSLWKAFVCLIWRPFALTRAFRKQGVRGPPYRFCKGSFHEFKSIEDASTDLVLDKNSHEITLRVLPHFHKWVQQYGGTFLFWFGTEPRICITDPEMIKQVLSNKFGFYQKIEPSPYFLALFGKGLTLLEGSEWARHRRIIRPAFAMDKLKMQTKEMAECTKSLLEDWYNQTVEAENQQKEIEVAQQMAELTADVICHTAFGSSYKEGKEVFLAQKELQILTAENPFSSDFPGFKYLPTKRNLHRWELEGIVRNKLMDIIQRRLDSRDHLQHKDNDMLGLMIESSQSQDSPMLSIHEIVEECKTFFFAGHETTSLLISWTIFLLSTNPDWQEQLRKEVLHECNFKEIPTADSLSKLKWVNMVLLETLRLYSPVFFIGRKAGKDVTLGNMRIPKGTGLAIPVPIVHRIEEMWGADANVFNPNRFANGVARAGRHPNAMLAFSTGPRTCIGQSFAMQEAKIVIAMILQRFSFSLSQNYKHAPVTYVTLQPKHGVPIIFKPLSV